MVNKSAVNSPTVLNLNTLVHWVCTVKAKNDGRAVISSGNAALIVIFL